MRIAVILSVLALATLSVPYFPGDVRAVTAREVFDEVIRRNLDDSFRVVLTVHTFKGKKAVSKHSLWLMGKTGEKTGRFVLDFEEPEESKGLRFLIIVTEGNPPEAYMYLPATKRTIPLAADDPSVDLGGTGLTMEDIDVFHLKGDEKAEIVGEEEVKGRQCYKIEVSVPGESGRRYVWISKDEFLVVKSENVDDKGKIERRLVVSEFFTTSSGKEFPREEEIEVPKRNIRIRVRQEHAVFGIELPEQLMDPKTFGTHEWRK
ncbi:MAG: outer membrane lipoprotein-sorting protein [Desulfomonilaceae bacterium]|nr:outer membrane lipoprotein-sorting protein [Desulfomonilaceae bacterium]